MRTNKRILGLIISGVVFLLASCDIVEVDPGDNQGSSSNNGNGSNQMAIVDRGSEFVPSDSLEILSVLHGNSSRVWVAEEFTISGLNIFQNCRLDDQIVLIDDGTYAYDGGDLLCGAEDDQRERNGTWELAFSSSRIVFDRGTELESSASLITLEDELVVLSGEYRSDLFGSFDVEGRYSSSN